MRLKNELFVFSFSLAQKKLTQKRKEELIQ